VSRTPATDERKVLSRELSVFLVQFSIALHKNGAYPPGHPLLNAAVESVVQRLGDLLKDRLALSIGVARTQLVIEGVATDQANPVLRELAQRLHRHQLGAIKFSRGFGADEIEDLLQLVGADVQVAGKPIGAGTPEELHRWPHVRLFPLAYDALELGAVESAKPPSIEGTAGALWLGLAAAALTQPGDANADLSGAEAGDVAQAINEHRRDASYAKVIVEYLTQLGRELQMSEGPESKVLRERVSGLLRGLKPEVLQQLLELGGDTAHRQQLVTDIATVMPSGAILELLQAASAASEQTISHSLLRILNKISMHAEAGSSMIRFKADAAMRDMVKRLVSSWNLEDPNPAGYSRMLDKLAKESLEAQDQDEVPESEAPRVIKTSLEIGVLGEPVWRAVDRMIEAGQVRELMNLLDLASDVCPNTEEYWEYLCQPASFRRLLQHDQGDFEGLDRLVQRMGLTGAEPMLEALEVADSRSARRRLLTYLTQLGPELGPMVVSRLPSAPWFVQRNILALIASMSTWPAEFSPETYAVNPDPRVRREAIKLMLRSPEHRAEAITLALADTDDQVVRMAFAAVPAGFPPAAMTRLMTLLNDGDRDAELRAAGIRALASVRTTAARSWLLARALTKGQWFRRRRLASKSPELLAILYVLAARWRGDPAAAEALELAAASSDPDIRAAIRPQAAPA
jgi:hypothetical protein